MSILRPEKPAAITPATDLAEEVRVGLGGPGPKMLPSRFLYDELGSALFDAISLLPEYGLTRADERILQAHASDIVSRLPSPLRVVELGSGSGRKTPWILGAVASRNPTTYHPIDVSPSALDRCRASMAGLPGVSVEPIVADYSEGLLWSLSRRKWNERLLVLFLGSTIGNFDRPEAEAFLRELRRLLRPSDALLLGTDLVKPVPQLLAAYDDALGVTAAFSRNVLVRINRELSANFDPRRFEHRARWNDGERRIEIRLVARRAHAVKIQTLDLEVRFRTGESIWTENSHKYEPDEPRRLGEAAGFDLAGQWVDRDWPFAETLFVIL